MEQGDGPPPRASHARGSRRERGERADSKSFAAHDLNLAVVGSVMAEAEQEAMTGGASTATTRRGFDSGVGRLGFHQVRVWSLRGGDLELNGDTDLNLELDAPTPPHAGGVGQQRY